MINFQLEEPNIERLIREGKARCAAMLYCPATMHQQTFQSAIGSTQINGEVNTDLLKERIEVNPLIVATETVKLDTATADAFYRGTMPTVHEGEPLATDRGWHFSLDVDTMPLGSIFQFNPEPELTGPMQIELDPSKTYVNIRVNTTQFQKNEHYPATGIDHTNRICRCVSGSDSASAHDQPRRAGHISRVGGYH